MTPPDPALIDKLVLANRILYDQGVVDGLGHVSLRHPKQSDAYLLSCNRAPARCDGRGAPTEAQGIGAEKEAAE